MRAGTDVLPVFVGLATLQATPARGREGGPVRSAAARRLAVALLVRASGVSGWQIAHEASGRPRTLNPSYDGQLDLSIAHSGAVIAAAVTVRGRIGIDVERQQPRENFRELAAFAFGPQEQAAVARDGLAGFYRIWTLREAMSKATGDGFGAIVDGTDRVADAPTTGFWIAPDRRWLRASLQPAAGLAMALALHCDQPSDAAGWRPCFFDWLDPEAGFEPLQSPSSSFSCTLGSDH